MREPTPLPPAPMIRAESLRRMASEEFQLLVLIMARKMTTSETLLASSLQNRSREDKEEGV